jgi:hypothetical protein
MFGDIGRQWSEIVREGERERERERESHLREAEQGHQGQKLERHQVEEFGFLEE